MNSTVTTAEDATTEQRSVLVHSSSRVVAAFVSVSDALEYPAHSLPSGSKVVDAAGRVRARLQREYSPAGRSLPVWVLEVAA